MTITIMISAPAQNGVRIYSSWREGRVRQQTLLPPSSFQKRERKGFIRCLTQCFANYQKAIVCGSFPINGTIVHKCHLFLLMTLALRIVLSFVLKEATNGKKHAPVSRQFSSTLRLFPFSPSCLVRQLLDLAAFIIYRHQEAVRSRSQGNPLQSECTWQALSNQWTCSIRCGFSHDVAVICFFSVGCEASLNNFLLFAHLGMVCRDNLTWDSKMF